MAWGNVENTDWTFAEFGNASSTSPDVETLSPSEGDGIVIILILYGGDDPVSSGMTGYTTKESRTTGTGPKLYLYEKEAGASESNPTATLTGSMDGAWFVLLFPGDYNSGTIIDQTGIASSGGLDSAPSITPTNSPSTVFAAVGDEFDTEYGSVPAGMTLIKQSYDASENRWHGAAYEDYTTTSATGSLTWHDIGGRATHVSFNVLEPPSATLTLNHTAYNADGYSPDSVFRLAGIENSITSGDTWEIVSGSESGGTVADYDYGDWSLDPPTGVDGPVTFDWIILQSGTVAKSITDAVDNGSGLVRLTITSHGLSTDDAIYIENMGGVTSPNGKGWKVTRVDANTVDLQGSSFSGTYTTGGDAVEVGYATHTHLVGGASAPTFSGTVPDQDVSVDSAFSLDLSSYFANSPTSYSSVGSSLPSGLSLNTSTGAITGTATKVGTYSTLSVRATNSNGDADTNEFEIMVLAKEVFVPFRRI